MARATSRARKRPGRARIVVERIVLGALMSVVVYAAERRLRKVLHEHPEPEEETEGGLFSKSVGIG